MKARTIITTGAALAALAVASTSASAMPVRNVQVSTWEYTAEVSATAYSPPSGACGAYYGIRIYSEYGEILRQRRGRFNACADWTVDGYWTVGYPRATFNVANLPAGTYTVCVAAGQNAGAGWYAHAVCRYRRI